jgi:Cu/Ag efflux pump CusA
MDISITDIFNALRKNNQNTGGAYIDKKPMLILLEVLVWLHH